MQRTFSDKLTAVTETFLFSYSFSRMKAYYTRKNCILLDGKKKLCTSWPCHWSLREIKINWIMTISPMIRDMIFAH